MLGSMMIVPPEISVDSLPPLVMVAGVSGSQVARTAEVVREENRSGSVLVHHDLRQITQGVVRRRVRRGYRRLFGHLCQSPGVGR